MSKLPIEEILDLFGRDRPLPSFPQQLREGCCGEAHQEKKGQWEPVGRDERKGSLLLMDQEMSRTVLRPAA